jgi:Protease inhibitor Inh
MALLAGALAAGCSGNPFGEGHPAPPTVTTPAAPPVNMAGRWRLVSANGGACNMTLTAPGGAEGTIAPEGGCPANFFTSRRWVFEQGSVVIQDHNRKQLLAMKQNATGRYEGTLANGEVIWLER